MSSRQQCLFLSAGLIVLTAMAYAPLWHNDFVNIDDGVYIWQNPHVQQGFTTEAIRWSFELSFRDDWRPYEANWHPLTWLSHILDCQLFGAAPTGSSPRGHHAANLLLHALSTVLLFWALLRLSGQSSVSTSANRWASAFVAALFALHPLHVEAVAWAAERKEVLCGLFWWLTLLAYAHWVEKPSPTRHLLVAACFALGLLSKPMIVMLPVVLILLDFWPLRRMTVEAGDVTRVSAPAVRRCVLEKWPLYLLSLASAFITYHAQQHGGTTSLLEPTALPIRLANAALSTVAYLRQTFWPTGLSVYYPHLRDEIAAQGWQALDVWGAFALLAVVTVAAVVSWRRCPWLFVGWFWYLVTLVPVIGIVQVGRQGRADRYTYIPLVGIFIAVSWGVAALLDRLEQRPSRTTGTDEPVRARHSFAFETALAGGMILLICGVLTWRQVKVWQNDLTLFGHALEVTSRNDCAEMNYGTALLHAGQLEEATTHLARAVEFRPNYIPARRNYAASLALTGNVAEATAQLRAALVIDLDFGLAARDLAKILATTNNDSIRHGPEALRWAQQALVVLGANDIETLSVLAMAQAETGDYVAAQQTALRAFELARDAGERPQLEALAAQIARYHQQRPVRLRWGSN
ncbi:MAG: glycosyltransferase family 39 protein [Pirellulales bacterium]|nr:glycosyltransferase family 39 protein [Pirellulales bacterium]